MTQEIENTLQFFCNEDWEIRKRSAEKLISMGNDAVPVLISSLSSNKNEDIRYWLIRVLGEINDPRGIQAILKVLKSNSKDFRAYAARALKNTNNRKITECLIQCLGDDAWRVAEAAAESLETIGEPAVQLLVEKLKNSSDNVAYWIIRILCRVNLDILIKFIKFDNKNIHLLITEALADSSDPRSILILLEFLSNKYWDVRQNAVESLVKQGEKVIIPMIKYLRNKEADIYYWAEKVFDSISILHMNPLFRLLEAGDRDIRIMTAKIMGKTRNPISIKPLLKSLDDECWFVAKSAANALIEIGRECQPNIIDLLKNDETNDNVKHWAAVILSRLGPEALSILIENLRAEDKLVRKLSAAALGEVKAPDALEPLIQTLKDSSWPVRNVAAASIIQYGGTVTNTVAKYLMDRDENVKLWTRRIIGEIGREYENEFIESLKGAKDPETRSCSAVALGVLRSQKGLTELLEVMFNDNDDWVRRYAASAVADIGDLDSLGKVLDLLQDPNPEVKMWVTEILPRFGPSSIEILKAKMKESERTEEKILLSVSLAEMGVTEMYPQLVKLMKADDMVRAQRSVRAAVNCGIDIIPVLIESLRDENENLRNNAVKALSIFGNKAVPFLKEAAEKKGENKNQNFWISKALREIEKPKIK
ncbi:MAG: hypothetical protein CVV64_05680 [Candidatus Wallbacteria bacterium HGW-Wallbacteria-1]|jgi:HEAT repeat protein|uniref:HEAT repeat domain-containing protein n=1 Tax=Candidatus Wallbacteria bacterium HGW-Wallbacteria-1 TaxID=2013854 RepID=A0A2N1PSF1_9BACT|nr:MAG: hypothetical protein CVV64_05680 [Candidatus Wallbacteria bacterium HGW-Wallbacteria-1]